MAVGFWCWPCLLAALAMLIMIALTLDEVVAMGLFLVQARREGQSLWRTFWLGGTLAGTAPDPVSARPGRGERQGDGVGRGAALEPARQRGARPVADGLPHRVRLLARAAHSDHLVGALVVTVAIIALADVGRAARFLNVAFGAWFIAAPWLLSGDTTTSAWNDVVVGIALILLSLPRGAVGERYGSWQRFIR